MQYYNNGHADCDNGHTQSFAVKRAALVAHAAARRYAGVAYLNGGAHPVHSAGCQRVDGYNKRRLNLFNNAPYYFVCLNAGNAEHAGGDGAHRAY